MKNFKNYLLTALISLVVGATLMFFLKPKPKCDPIIETVCETEMVYIDTCMMDIRVDTFYVTKPVIKKGKKEIFEAVPEITKVEKQDSTYRKTYTKAYNSELFKASIKFDVVSTDPSVDIQNYRFEHSMDTLLLKEMYRETQTIVLQPSVTETTKFLPTESTARFLKAVGGLSYDDKLFYQLGGTVELKPLEVTVLKNIKREGGSLNISVPLIKIKK